MSDKLREAKQSFEEISEVPDFLDFDGEDYMYYEEDPVLEEQSRITGAQWRGFSACYKRLHQPTHETVEHEYWKDMFERLVSSIGKIGESMRKEDGIAQEYGYDLMTVVDDMENGDGP